MTLVILERWTAYLILAIEIGLLTQLLRYSIARKYCWLFCYFLADILQTLIGTRLSPYSKWYGYVYFGGQAMKAVLGLIFTMQLWDGALSGYPAVARFGRQVVIFIFLAAMLAAAAGLYLEPPTTHGQSATMHQYQAIEGAVNSMVLLFLAGMVIFLVWFPLKMTRNIAVCIAGFVFCSFERWAGLLLVNLHPKNAHVLSESMLLLLLASLMLWLFAIRREGEIVTTVVGHGSKPAEAERLLGILDGINVRLTGILSGKLS